MYKLLTKMGYCIKDNNGKHFFGWNISDIVCLSLYFTVSIYNLAISSPSYSVWVLNLAIMVRIIIRNTIEIKELKNFYSKTNDLHVNQFINWHSNKLVAEVSVNHLRFGVIDNTFGTFFFAIGFIVLLLSFGEDLLRIIEKMYYAVLPSQTIQENT